MSLFWCWFIFIDKCVYFISFVDITYTLDINIIN